MPGSMTHRTAAKTSALGYGEPGFVEGQGTKPKKENCKNLSDGGRKLCMSRNFDNGYGYVMGGSNKKRKTKMQKKKKNRRTLRKMSKKKIGGVPSSYPQNQTDIDRILGDAPTCDSFVVFDQKNNKITDRSRFELTEASDKVTFRTSIINNNYGLAAICE